MSWVGHYVKGALDAGVDARDNQTETSILYDHQNKFISNVDKVSAFSTELALAVVSYFQKNEEPDSPLRKTCEELSAKLSSTVAAPDLRTTLTPGPGENVTVKPVAAQQFSASS